VTHPVSRPGAINEIGYTTSGEANVTAEVQDAAGTGGGPADQVTQLAQLRDQGVITEEQFQQGKAKILA
jgi:hypothetical protein